VTSTRPFRFDIAYADEFAAALRAGEWYETAPVAVRAGEQYLQTPHGDRFRVGEFAVTFLPRLLDAGAAVRASEPVELSFHATSVGLTFTPEAGVVTVRVDYGSEVGPPLRAPAPAVVEGCLDAVETFLQYVAAVAPERRTHERVMALERALDAARGEDA